MNLSPNEIMMAELNAGGITIAAHIIEIAGFVHNPSINNALALVSINSAASSLIAEAFCNFSAACQTIVLPSSHKPLALDLIIIDPRLFLFEDPNIGYQPPLFPNLR